MGRKHVAYTDEQLGKWLSQRFPEIDWTPTLEKLPPIVWRSRWDRLADRLGLPYTRKHIANLDSQGVGPASIEV